MLFKPGTPVYSFEIQREAGEDVMYINFLGANSSIAIIKLSSLLIKGHTKTSYKNEKGEPVIVWTIPKTPLNMLIVPPKIKCILFNIANNWIIVQFILLKILKS